MDCDVAIIGSGFGGSVCAARAAEAGMRVVVLERGRRMTDTAYAELADGRAPLIHRADEPGLIQFHRMPGLAAVTGSAVGGTSHVYTAVTLPAPREIFTDAWPGDLRWEAMQKYYERVLPVIAPRPVPHAFSRTRALHEAGERLGGRATTLPLAMDFFDHASDAPQEDYPTNWRGQATTYLRGGATGKKRTLDRTYLPRAETAGAVIRPLHEVQTITPIDGGYRVGFRQLVDGEWRTGTLTARRVVVAAGTINTLALLLLCRDEKKTLPMLSAALGERFFTNGDLGALLLGPKCGLEPDDGPPVTAWLDWWKEDRLYLMELNSLVKGRAWCFGVMGFDDNPGRITLDGHGRLKHMHTPDRGHVFHRRSMERLRELAKICRARLLTLPDFVTRRTPITVHPLGGAAMADSCAHGVTDSFGQVFGCPGLYIADGSLLPTPTGGAPSMTIAALAERVAEHLIDHA